MALFEIKHSLTFHSKITASFYCGTSLIYSFWSAITCRLTVEINESMHHLFRTVESTIQNFNARQSNWISFPPPHLYPLLLEVYLHSQLFPEDNIRVVSLGEGLLQVLQLLLCEDCPVPPLPLASSPSPHGEVGVWQPWTEATRGKEGGAVVQTVVGRTGWGGGGGGLLVLV